MDHPVDINPPYFNLVRGLAGALVGGAAGFFAFGWLAGQGFYAMALPGIALGVGAGIAATDRSLTLAMLCGALALLLSIFAEWKNFPFVQDDSLGYFLTHLFDLRPFTLLMLAVGTVGGFWFAWRAGGKRRSSASPTGAIENPTSQP